MKKTLLLIIFFLLFIFNSRGQNLVPNGDFEQYSNCPFAVSDFNGFVLNWFDPTLATPDYFNQCSGSTLVSVPGNFAGYQYAHSGNAYCGIVVTRKNNNANYREYLEIQLTTALAANACYHFEMYFSLANKSQYITDDIQIYFSDVSVSGIMNTQFLPFIPQITNAPGNYPDTVNWTLVSGNYSATGNENYLIIGNFKDSVATNTILFNQNTTPYYSHVYIDGVSLTPCTGIEEQNQYDAIKIYPNPVKDELLVSGLKFLVEEKMTMKIFDVLGKEAQPETRNLKPETRINVSALKSGIYFLEINDGKNSFRKKFLKE